MMIKRGLLAGVLMVASAVAMADRGPAGGPHYMNIDKLEILLDLDAYQKQEVAKILEARRTEMLAKREQMRASQTRPSFEERQTQREAVRQATRTKLAKLLSEQQLKKFDVLTERPPMRQARRDRGEKN